MVAEGQGLLSRSHLGGLKAQGVKRLILSLDNDQVGPINTAKALEQLSEVAQLDYQYRDVRDWIERLRKELEGGGDAPPKPDDADAPTDE